MTIQPIKDDHRSSTQPDLEELGQDRRHHQRSTHHNSLQWHTVEGHSYNPHTLSSFQFCCPADTCSQAPKTEAHRILLDQVPCKCTTLQSQCTQNCRTDHLQSVSLAIFDNLHMNSAKPISISFLPQLRRTEFQTNN